MTSLAIPFRPALRPQATVVSPTRPPLAVVPIPQREKTRSALIVGINYNGANKLRGCVEDATRMEDLLVKEYGLKAERLIRLRDKQATAANIIDSIKKLAVNPTDYVHVIYSGHGSYLPDLTGDEDDRRDEVLVPWDYDRGLILDDELWQLWRLFPATTTLFLHMDSCHSATVARGFTLASIKDRVKKYWHDRKARFLDASEITTAAAISARQGYADTRSHVVGRLYNAITTPAEMVATRNPDPVCQIVSLSGCQDWQESADAQINGKWCGAMTNYFLAARKSLGGSVSWEAVHSETERLLRTNGYAQLPMLGVCNSPDDEILKRPLFV